MALTRTYSRFKRHRGRLMAALVIIVLACSLVFAAFALTEDDRKAQSAETIRTAIIKSAQQCAAIEGAYPASLEYLEENYGLVINHNDYVIKYEAFAQNVPPTVSVVPR